MRLFPIDNFPCSVPPATQLRPNACAILMNCSSITGIAARRHDDGRQGPTLKLLYCCVPNSLAGLLWLALGNEYGGCLG